MDNILDVFSGNAFGVLHMTESILQLPYAPGRLGAMKIFKPEPIATTSIALEVESGTVSLIESTPRGIRGKKRKANKRNIRNLTVPHFEEGDTVMADSLQNVREFGKNSATVKSVSTSVNDSLQDLRLAHEVTHEYLRVGAVKGTILDGDGTTVLLDLFNEFGISQTVVDFDLTNASSDIRQHIKDVLRAIQTALGGTAYTGVIALCGDTFYDTLAGHDEVKDAVSKQNDGTTKFLLETQGVGYAAPRFEFGGVVWENYRGKIGDVDFIGPNDCHFIVVGVPGLYREYSAPAPFVETVNTRGKVVYAKQKMTDFDTGVELTTVSCFLALATRPKVLVKGTLT